MKPTARQLVESISWSLDARVTPHVEDKWAASTLRSVHCLLEHLAVRVDAEGPLLHEDNADLAATSATVVVLLADATGPVAETRDALAALGARSWRAPDAYPTTTSLAEENDAWRTAVDLLLRALRTGDEHVDPDRRAAAEAAIDDQLRRRLQRDQPLFAPAFMSSTF